MNKILVFSLIAFMALGANVASAQGYYYTSPTYGTPVNSFPAYGVPAFSIAASYPQYGGACVNIASDLSYGSGGTQVRQLQTFLVAQNFPGSGAWMITGNFRSATLAAVRNFQQQQGLPVTGVVDAATRAAINRVSCGGYGVFSYGNTYPYVAPPVSNYGYGNNTNCYYTFPYTCNYSGYGYGNVSLSSLSVVSGLPGASVTIYGSGFDYSNNTVYFGQVPVTNIPSYNGTSITFTVPSYATAGTVGVYVVNSRGTSGTLSFGVLASYGCLGQYSSYVYGSYGGSGYGYCPPTSQYPTITYVNPTSGSVGTSVTVYGTGFSYSGNTVRFGSATIANISSYNGTSLTFTVPTYLSGTYGSSVVTPGTYSISVSNSSGYTSNAVSFTVTSGAYGAPTISNLNGPTSLNTGVQGTWTIRVHNPYSSYMTTSVNWGDSGLGYASASVPQTTYQQGENTLTFTHTYQAAGTYTVVFTVSNSSGQSNTLSATVVVSGSGQYGNVALTSITPMSARVGMQIALSGSGFTPLENTVHFGIGGTQHVPSQNGTVIYYTIPAYVSPCDLVVQGGACTLNVQQVLPGPIQVYVKNNNGTTNTIQLQIVQ